MKWKTDAQMSVETNHQPSTNWEPLLSVNHHRLSNSASSPISTMWTKLQVKRNWWYVLGIPSRILGSNRFWLGSGMGDGGLGRIGKRESRF